MVGLSPHHSGRQRRVFLFLAPENGKGFFIMHTPRPTSTPTPIPTFAIRSIAVVPAKGHSRRLPGKNKRRLHGKPLFLYTVEAARRGGISTILVTSDDPEILAVAEAAGAIPIFRPRSLADDFPDLEIVKAHALTTHAKSHRNTAPDIVTGADYDAVFMLLPTYPFRSAADISRSLELLQSGLIWEVRSGSEIERCGRMLLPNSYLAAHLLPDARQRLGCPPIPISAWIAVDRLRGIDIDDPDDWARAERAFSRFDFTTGTTISPTDLPAIG